jgi:hypothetical protein
MFQQQGKLLFGLHPVMVLALVRDIPPHCSKLRPADAAGEISFLPLESHSRMLIHPTRGICLQYLRGLGDA